MKRAEDIKAEREQLLEQRSLMKKEIEQQKRDISHKLEKMRQGKIDPAEILNSLSIQQSSIVAGNKVPT